MFDSNSYHHIYNRGAHKALVFQDGLDYWRMLKLLYIANNEDPFDMFKLGHLDIFSIKRKCVLVDIIAYCLMPNHVHIVVRDRGEASPPGASIKFIHKLMTGYSGYFNKKYDHSGTVWQGPYNSKPVCDEQYFNVLIDYVHLNPYGIITPNMTKEARAERREEAVEFSRNYEYSSYKDRLGISRLQSCILGEARPPWTGEASPPPNPTPSNTS